MDGVVDRIRNENKNHQLILPLCFFHPTNIDEYFKTSKCADI